MIKTHRSARFYLLLLLYCCISIFAGATEAPLLQVTYIDVGQGDAVLVRTQEKTILIDAGDDNKDAANGAIIPYLKKEGIRHIDVAVISHPHRDHFGGFIDLIPAISIGKFYYAADTLSQPEKLIRESTEAKIYRRMHDMIVEKNIPYVKASLNDKLDWGKDIKVEVLHVSETRDGDYENPLKVNQNNNSIALKVTAGKISYLFSGDAEKEAEATMVEMFGKKLKSTVYKAGHHGSKTSSSHAFLDAVQPEYAIICVGADNSFKHPSPSTLDKFDYHNTKYFRTDIDGTVESYTDGKTVKFVSNSTPIEFAKKPEFISLTPNSATIQWTTNKPATSEIFYGVTTYSKKKIVSHAVKTHTMTLTGLAANREYMFKVVSTDPRETQHKVVFESTFKTPKGNGVELPKIEKISTNFSEIYMKNPFKVSIPVINPASTDTTGITLELYHSAIAEGNKIKKISFKKLPADSVENAVISTEIDWIGNVELIAVLKQANTILDTASLNVKVLSKLFMVDCSHGNIDYYTGKFAGMKMDLYQKLGFKMRSISKSITFDKIKDAFVVTIPHPKKDFTAAEITALDKYISQGGSILMYCQADYRNSSNPHFLNKVLSKVGSRIRFNDDEICDPNDNIGAPWKWFVTTYPSKLIKGVEKLLVRSSCSLISNKNTGLKAAKNLHLLATGDDNTYNIELDKKDDGYIYASHTPDLPVPLAACEDLGFGRIACVGDKLYTDAYYNPKSTLHTPSFNRQIVSWLGLGKEKTLKELFSFTASLEQEMDEEIKSDRLDKVSSQIFKRVRSELEQDSKNTDKIEKLLKQHQEATVESIRDRINQMLKFNNLHD